MWKELPHNHDEVGRDLKVQKHRGRNCPTSEERGGRELPQTRTRPRERPEEVKRLGEGIAPSPREIHDRRKRERH